MEKHGQIPESDLKWFQRLKDVQVMLDVGARDDDDYALLKPEMEYHAFEPNPVFFANLQERLKDRPNTYLNNYGLGDEEGDFIYNEGIQAFEGGENPGAVSGVKLPIKTLDWYVEANNITRIDFLKIDTEGFDFKVLKGAAKALQMTRYIQYEHWDDKLEFHFLESAFDMLYFGGRNVLCVRKPWDL